MEQQKKDIVDELRALVGKTEFTSFDWYVLGQASGEIHRLRSDLVKLKELVRTMRQAQRDSKDAYKMQAHNKHAAGARARVLEAEIDKAIAEDPKP